MKYFQIENQLLTDFLGVDTWLFPNRKVNYSVRFFDFWLLVFFQAKESDKLKVSKLRTIFLKYELLIWYDRALKPLHYSFVIASLEGRRFRSPCMDCTKKH